MRHRLALLALCALFLLPALSSGAETQGEGTSGEGSIRWKMATLAPRNLGWAQQVRAIILPWTKRNTDDNLRWKIYWGGIMGNDEDYLRKIHIGQLQGAGVSGHGANLACPEFSVLGLPFLFDDWEEVDYIRAEMFPTFDYYYEQYGYKLLLWIDQDFDQIYSAKWRFDNLEDFRKSRFQGWYGPQETAMLKALGATPIPMPPTEANTGYRTGIVDSNIGPAIFQVGSQMYTSCKYMNTMKTRYAPAALIVDLKTWRELPGEYRQRLEAERPETQTQFCVETRKDNEKCIEGMIRYGLESVQMTPEARKAIMARAMTIYDDLSGDLYPPGLLTEVRRYLADFRRERGRAAPMVAAAPARPVAKPEPEMAATAEAKPMVEQAAPMRDAAPRKASRISWEERKRQITEVQKVLKPMGLYDFKVDGLFGPITSKGITEYQKVYGLKITGRRNNELLDHMGIQH
ncbi:MAG: TRAP transporter substrate-binding protein DctP [Proteobacteria bacterium]|nr:TRAP transporter substrate-binding protein DctP [Pseudomonadota bacterium]